MCCFFIVIKLLMLKILLAGLTDLSAVFAYDYRYHPSAEEFDNLLSETHRTWTHSFLKAERDRLFVKPAERHYKAAAAAAANYAKTQARYFVPKFQYENSDSTERNAIKQNYLPNQDLQMASTQKKYGKPLPYIQSTLEFNYFSDELPKPLQPTTTTTESPKYTEPISSAAAEVYLKPLAKPEILTSHNFHKNNKTQSYVPIYFANPATGIIYAIMEVGKSNETMPTSNNGTIPIFVTKEQYEKDIMQIKDLYQEKCQNKRRLTATSPPTINRLQKPLATILPINSTQFSPNSASPKPNPLKQPPPVIIKTELIVKDKSPALVIRPLRKKKNKLKPTPKPRPKIKKQKRPGHKPVSTTIRTILQNQSEGPKIIMGTRKDNEKLPTQLEKPNFDIFSGTALPQKAKKEPKHSHRVNKRSLEQINNSRNTKSLQKKYLKISKIHNKENLAKIYLKNSFTNESDKLLHDYLIKYFQANPQKIITKNSKKLIKGSLYHNGYSSENVKQNFLKNFSSPKTKENLSKSIISNKNYSKTVKPKIPTLVVIVNSIHNKKPTKSESDSKDEKESNWNLKNNFVPSICNHLIPRENIGPSAPSNLLNKSNLIQTTTKFKMFTNKESLKSASESKTKNFRLNSCNESSINSQKNKKENFLNNLKGSSKRLPKNYLFRQFKHHVNKRSAVDLATTNDNFTLPKFMKKSQNNFPTNGTTINNKSLQQPNKTNSNISTTSLTENRKNRKKIVQGKKKTQFRRVKKRKRLSKLKAKYSSGVETLPRTARPDRKNQKMEKNSKAKQNSAYYIFEVNENYDEDDDEEEDEDEDYEDEDYDNEEEEEDEEQEENQSAIIAYDEEPYQVHTIEAGLSIEDPRENTTTQATSSSSTELATDKMVIQNPLFHYDNKNEIALTTKPIYIKKRFRRRPPKLKINEDYEYEDDDDDNSLSSNLGGFFRMIFYPIQMVMSSVLDTFGSKDADEEDDSSSFNSYTKYTPYHKTLKQHTSDEYDDDDDDYYDSNESGSSSLSSWLSSWFAFNRRNKKIGSTTVAPIKTKPTKAASSSWLPSWLNFGANDRISTESVSNEDYDEYDKWFASWFGQMKPKIRKRTTTTTTSTTTQIPHVPILTIVDPMRNPQNWIGILAHHIINHTSSSTANPLKDIWNKVTTTTTENPEIPVKISYDKYQIWRLKPQDDSQVKALEEYKKSEDGIKLQWLKGPSLRGLTDVLVPPKMLMDFQASLTFELIDHEVLIFDVGKAIAYEKSKEDYFITTTQKPKKHQSKNPSTIASMTWHKYYEYDDIIKYLETMRMRFPHLVDLIHIGRSYEGRPLIVMKIESKEAAALNSAHYSVHERNKLRHKKRIGLANAVFIEAGTHGLEWIGPATATWIINELLRIMKKNVTDDQSFIRNTTWYIMPVLNPDGYVYSHEFDRFWKKSRSRHVTRPSGILSSAMTWLQKKRTKEKVCFGVDLDRNWHYQWGRRGSSKSACNEFYAGPTPFSEPETKALSDFLMDYRTQIKLFVSMQAYGQIISYPYKANTTYDSERLDDLLDVAMVGTDGLRKKGSKARYKIDSSNDLVENRSGCSDAFAAYEASIPFSYTLLLADNGVHGYLLPSASIESTARDSFEIISGMLDYI